MPVKPFVCYSVPSPAEAASAFEVASGLNNGASFCRYTSTQSSVLVVSLRCKNSTLMFSFLFLQHGPQESVAVIGDIHLDLHVTRFITSLYWESSHTSVGFIWALVATEAKSLPAVSNTVNNTDKSKLTTKFSPRRKRAVKMLRFLSRRKRTTRG